MRVAVVPTVEEVWASLQAEAVVHFLIPERGVAASERPRAVNSVNRRRAKSLRPAELIARVTADAGQDETASLEQRREGEIDASRYGLAWGKILNRRDSTRTDILCNKIVKKFVFERPEPHNFECPEPDNLGKRPLKTEQNPP
jgi:hypothetical protein